MDGWMVSGRVSGDKTDWSLKIKNADNGRVKVISKLDEEGLKARGRTSFSSTSTLHLTRAPG